MHRLGSLVVIACCGCHSNGAAFGHAFVHASNPVNSLGYIGRAAGHVAVATVADPDLAYLAVSAADAIISAVQADHASYDAEDDDDDAMRAASAALAAAPRKLDREMIATALDAAAPSVARCARPAATRIAVSIVVMPSGTVDRVIVRDKVDAATADCIRDALHVTLFPMTERGGAFTYPFTL